MELYDRETINRTLIGKAKAAFEAARTGTRGRDAFAQLHDATVNLRLAGLDPDKGDEAYATLGTTRDAFNALLHDRYRLAALQNYEDSTDERFNGSGRAISETISDLHLVPHYMQRGGLDPKDDASWKEIGIDKNAWLALYHNRLVQEAARSHDMAHQDGRSAHNAILAMEATLFYLQEAGYDTDKDEEAFGRIGTTRKDFFAFIAQKRQSQFTFPTLG